MISPFRVARLLQMAYASCPMPEFTSTLPNYPVGASLHNFKLGARAEAPQKTENLADVNCFSGTANPEMDAATQSRSVFTLWPQKTARTII